MKPAICILFLIFSFSACQPVPAEPVSPTDQSASYSRQPKMVPERYNVAFLIMNGVYNTELTAPYDIFQHTIFREGIRAMNTFLVAKFV